MTEMEQQIGKLKDQWREDHRITRREIERLQAHLDELKHKLDTADEILQLSRPAGKVEPTPTFDGVGKYSEKGVTEAIKDFFTEHRFTKHGISELVTRLGNEGLRTEAQNLRATISMTCRRLQKEEGFLLSELRNGSRMFWLADKAIKPQMANGSR
jgi:hypothetical protein